MTAVVKYSKMDFSVTVLYNGVGFQLYALDEDLQFILSNGDTVTAPAGFRTDGRSSPGFLKGQFATWGKAARAWVLHDLLYVLDYGVERYGWTRKQARKFADVEMLNYSNKLDPVNRHKNWLSYKAVRMFGAKIYDQDRETMLKLKRNG